jgi:pimeloyl-ACP methyl ester carboxylesterase
MSASLSRHERAGLRYFRGGSGPSLLLLHGIPGSSHTWRSAGRLLAAHYDVIIPDLGGFGASPSLDEDLHLDHELYLEAHAEAVHRLLDALDVQALYLGGHDFGGPVAVTLLRLFPEYAVHGLVLGATNLFTDPFVPLPLRLAGVPVLGPTVFRLFAGTRPGLRLLYRVAAHHKAAFPLAAFNRHLTPAGVEQTWRIFHRSLANLEASYRDVEAALPDLDVPTIVLWGDRDPFFPTRAARRLVDTLPDATLSIFEETGHFVPEERPEMTAGHIDDFFRARTAARSHPDREESSL